MSPGEIYMADLGESTPQPIIVVSREELNWGDRVVAVLCTSQKFAVRSKLAHSVPFQAGQFGFTKVCVAQRENILPVDKDSLDPNPIGVLDDVAIRDLIKALGHVFDSDCEPNGCPRKVPSHADPIRPARA
jgi:mRNA-degrading endonuclease toxin of MazEF toxin-antitoxin module